MRSRVGALLALLVPQPLHHELEVGRLDANDAVPTLDGSSPDLADADLAGDDLVEHRLDEPRLDLDGALLGDTPVVLRNRLHDRCAGGGRIEMLESEIVPEHARDPSPEDVELGQRILAYGKQEVHPEVGAVHDLGEVDRERAGAVLATVVEEVLLRLIEDDVQVTVEDLLPGPKGLGQRALLVRRLVARPRAPR